MPSSKYDAFKLKSRQPTPSTHRLLVAFELLRFQPHFRACKQMKVNWCKVIENSHWNFWNSAIGLRPTLLPGACAEWLSPIHMYESIARNTVVQGQRGADEQYWKLADSSLAAPYFDDGIQKLVLDWHLAIVKNSVYMQVIFVYNKIFLPVSCFILQIYQSNQPRKLISE